MKYAEVHKLIHIIFCSHAIIIIYEVVPLGSKLAPFLYIHTFNIIQQVALLQHIKMISTIVLVQYFFSGGGGCGV